jgi:hypothetical protein
MRQVFLNKGMVLAKDISYIKHIKRKNMNIQNLNPQELEQLQTLLNKINPQPQLDVDPVEEMINGIMECFDFKRVQEVMDYLDWEWRGEHVTLEMLQKEAKRLLRGAAESRLDKFRSESDEVGIINATGGLEATAYCDENKENIVRLELKFVLSSWDESIDED